MTKFISDIPDLLAAEDHAKLGPSSAKRWFACPGSILLEAPIPNKSSEAADDGTACHAVAAWCLTEHRTARKRVMDWVVVSATGEPERKVQFTEDMAERVQLYVDKVRLLTIGADKVFIETRVHTTPFLGVENQFGTLDFGAVKYEDHEIHVVDAKFGYQPVEVEGNKQCMLYALGMLHMLASPDAMFDELTGEIFPVTAAEVFEWARAKGIERVRIGICQPRVFAGISEWVCTLDELETFAELARQKASAVEGAAQMLKVWPRDQWERTYLNPKPNADECAFCRAMATCPAARRELEETVGADFEVIVQPNVTPLDVMDRELLAAEHNGVGRLTRLGQLMGVTDFLEDFIKAVRAETERALLAAGNATEVQQKLGFGLDTGRQGNRAFTDLEEAEEMLLKQFRLPIKDVYAMKLKSPTQLEKLTETAEGEDKPAMGPTQWKKLNKLVDRAPGKPSVKPVGKIKTPYVVPKLDANDFQPVAGLLGPEELRLLAASMDSGCDLA